MFERAYTTCPLCTPARAALFTGIYAHTSGPWTNNLPLGTNIRSMGQIFRDQGYYTAYMGKWHLDGHDYFGTGICPPGWDPAYWYDGSNYLAELSDDEIALWRRGLNSLADLRKYDIRAEFTWAHRVSDRAIACLRNLPAEPFLLVISYDEPHHPFTCPPVYAEKFADFEYSIGRGAHDELDEKPAHHKEWAEATKLNLEDGKIRHPLYFGCNSFIDSEIGRVVEEVNKITPENTCIIFTSDHGDMLGAHHLTGKGPAMYEEITRIPLIVQMPGKARAGVKISSPVSHIDLLPTMLDMAGIPCPSILEGESLSPLVLAETELSRPVIMEFNRYEIEHDSWGGFQPVRCIVAGDYKLVINLLSSDELYNLRSDPAEVENLIDEAGSATIRDSLHDRLLDWMNQKRDPFRGPAWERRPWRESRRLRWRGRFRPRPGDGVAPPVRDYDTGQPAAGDKIEYG